MEVGGEAANLHPLFLMMPPVMSTKGACTRMETSAIKSTDGFLKVKTTLNRKGAVDIVTELKRDI